MRGILIWILALSFLACKKNTPLNEANEFKITTKDTLKLPKKTSQENGRAAAHRRVKGNTVFRTVKSAQLPFSISEELEHDGELFILEIENFEKNEIEITLFPENESQNIRIGQILLDSEPVGGPFGRTAKMAIPKTGKVSLKIGKNMMAEGSSAGSFRIEVK